jgi:hypothetical protein
MKRARMTTSRRFFLQSAAAGTLAGVAASATSLSGAAEPRNPTTTTVTKSALDRILDQPVLVTDFLKQPVIVASIELLRNGKQLLLRTRSADGAEAVTVPNSDRLANTYPLLLNQVIPVFVNKDARTVESLLWDVYRFKDN